MHDGGPHPMDELSAHLDRGWELAMRGELAGARISAEQCLGLDEESPEAHNLMGYVLAAEGRSEEALSHYERALEIDETYLEVMLNAAEVLLTSLNRPEEALRLLREALELCESEEERADTLLVMLDASVQAGRLDEVEALAADLPEGPFENPDLDVQVGRVHLDLGDPERALRHLERALQRDPANPDAHYFLGLLRLARNEPVAALQSLIRSRELDAASPPPPWSLPRERFEAVTADALHRLPKELSARLEGAAIVVTGLPGVEVVADGVDPRLPVLVDRVDDAGRVERMFVYQRNVERGAGGALGVSEEVLRCVEEELRAVLEDDEEPDGEPPTDPESVNPPRTEPSR